MAAPLIPSPLPLIPLLPPQVLFPHLRANMDLDRQTLSVVCDLLIGHSKHDGNHHLDIALRFDHVVGKAVAVVPVSDGDKRVGRWACAAVVRGIQRDEEDEEQYMMTVEGVSRIYLPPALPPTLSILPSHPIPTSTYSLPLSPSPPTINLLPYATRLFPPRISSRLGTIPASLLADLLVTVLRVDWEKRVEVLGVPDVDERGEMVRSILIDLLKSKGIQPEEIKDIDWKTSLRTAPSRQSVSQTKSRKLPEDLEPIHSLFSSRQHELSSRASDIVSRELNRLSKIPTSSPEYSLTKTYIETLLDMPWKRASDGEILGMDAANNLLNEGHEGLEDVKRRVVEFLAVYRLKRDLWKEQVGRQGESDDEGSLTLITSSSPSKSDKDGSRIERQTIPSPPPPIAPILLLVGPPGVGKTSIASSLAACLSRPFHRISLGGVRDESTIRGHRRTYVGAMMGSIAQGVRRLGVSDGVILLDEVDKLGTSSFHGDPSAALLEVLDPEQNNQFHDHYLGEVPLDLSKTLFIATANSLQPIPPPLLDRMEVIHCPGYIIPEKLRIAERFLLPKQISENGLTSEHMRVGKGVVKAVVEGWTHESGVRGLERQLGKICRRKAVEFSRYRESDKGGNEGNEYDPTVEVKQLEKILGPARGEEWIEGEFQPGMVNGLTYDSSGNGSVLILETMLIPGGRGDLRVTGQVGEVFKESVELCLTWVKSNAKALGITTPSTNPFRLHDIHYHAPEGSIKKDGPSAGLGTVMAFVSLLTGKAFPARTAVTGEMSLRGRVLRIGGVREKVLGAQRAGISRIILPRGNASQVDRDVPAPVKEGIDFVYVENVEQALEEVWGNEIWIERKDRIAGVVQARL